MIADHHRRYRLCCFGLCTWALILFIVWPSAATPPAEHRYGQEAELITEVAEGLVRAVERERWAWYECGAITPPEEYMERALRITIAMRTALLENGLSHPYYLWGAMGIVWQESRGNPCPLGPHSRKWAAAKKLVAQKHLIHWTAEDALRVMTSPKLGKRGTGVDAGLGQTIWPNNARIRVHDGISRPATPEEMVTVEGSSRALAYHLQQNAQLNPRRPWAYWPGIPQKTYAEKIEGWVRVMHGPNIGPAARWR